MTDTEPAPCILPGRTRPHIQLRSNGGITSKLLIDGEDASSAVTGLTLTAGFADTTRMELSIFAFPLTADIEECAVYLKPETHDLLVRLGWTPPPEADGEDK